MWNARLLNHMLESRLLGEISTTSYAQMTPELKSLLMKKESEKVDLKLTSQKLRSWHPVPSLHGKQMGKQWKQWQTIFLGLKITADGDCSHEIKWCILLGRKAMTNIDSILKSRDKGPSSQGYMLSPCLLNLLQSTSCKMPGWMKHKLESRFPGEISITSDMQMIPPLWQKAKN